MSEEMNNYLMVKGMKTLLSQAQQEAVDELVLHIETVIKTAGEPVGSMALTLVGLKAQMEASK